MSKTWEALPGEGLGPIRLGSDVSTALERLGEPRIVSELVPKGGVGTRWFWSDPSVQIHASVDDRIVSVTVTDSVGLDVTRNGMSVFSDDPKEVATALRRAFGGRQEEGGRVYRAPASSISLWREESKSRGAPNRWVSVTVETEAEEQAAAYEAALDRVYNIPSS